MFETFAKEEFIGRKNMKLIMRRLDVEATKSFSSHFKEGICKD